MSEISDTSWIYWDYFRSGQVENQPEQTPVECLSFQAVSRLSDGGIPRAVRIPVSPGCRAPPQQIVISEAANSQGFLAVVDDLSIIPSNKSP